MVEERRKRVQRKLQKAQFGAFHSFTRPQGLWVGIDLTFCVGKTNGHQRTKFSHKRTWQPQQKKNWQKKKGFLRKFKTYTRKGRQKMTESQPKLGGKNSGSQTSVRLCPLCLSPPATDSPPWFKVLRVLCNKRETVVIQRWTTRWTQTHKMIQLPIWMPTLTGCLTRTASVQTDFCEQQTFILVTFWFGRNVNRAALLVVIVVIPPSLKPLMTSQTQKRRSRDADAASCDSLGADPTQPHSREAGTFAPTCSTASPTNSFPVWSAARVRG